MTRAVIEKQMMNEPGSNSGGLSARGLVHAWAGLFPYIHSLQSSLCVARFPPYRSH
jgi:hypothetical protein